MTEQEAINQMNKMITENGTDHETIHYELDIMAMKLLTTAGYVKFVELFNSQKKWYA